jgi:uncharacterized protein (DUF302 family)
MMEYYFSKTLREPFDMVVEKVTEALKKEQFGILTQISVDETLKKKLDIDFKRYLILGACNPYYAYKALTAEDKIGTMLPCNVIVQQRDKDTVEVAAINPIASMQAVQNEALGGIAQDVTDKLKRVIEDL